MKKQILILALLLAALMLYTGCSADNKDSDTGKSASPAKKEQMFFATGTPGGVYEILGTGMVNIINKNAENFELVAVTPAQLNQAPNMLQVGQASFSIGMACMFERAWEGIQDYKDNAKPDIVQVLGMYDNVMTYVAAENSKLNDMKDITEKTIISSTASNKIIAEEALTAIGKFDPAKMTYRVMSYAQAVEALKDGNIDVLFLTSYPYSGTLDSLVTAKGIKYLTFDDETRSKFDKLFPRQQMKVTPANTYKDQPKDVWGPTVYTVLYANKNVPDDVIKQVCAAVLNNNKDLSTVHSAGKNITVEKTAEYLEKGIMTVDRMHPGAVAYFKEKGIIK